MANQPLDLKNRKQNKMQLKRFVAKTTPTALDAVKSAFGTDAIILANRKVGTDVEIIATGKIEDSVFDGVVFDDSVSEVSDIKNDSNEETSISDREPDYGSSVTSSEVPDIDESKPTKPEVVRAEVQSKGADLESSEEDRSRNPDIGTTTSSVEVMLQTAVDKMNGFEGGELEKTLDTMFSRIEQRFRGIEVNLWGSCEPHRRDLLGHLLRLGVGAELAIRLVERVSPDLSPEESLRETMSLLANSLPIGSNEPLSEPGITILAGLPGSGKSTVMMKLANDYVARNGNSSIVLICADTSKIGAFESIQVFGKLLGVPVVQAHTSEELENLLLAFRHKSLILIEHPLSATLVNIGQELNAEPGVNNFSTNSNDTEAPGGLPNSTKCVESNEQKSGSSKYVNAIRRVAVLSASSQNAPVEALVSRKLEYGFDFCVLSHLDEQAKLGELFSSLVRHQLRVTSWSDCASLQKPMEKADASILVATAIAMSKRLKHTEDDTWLLDLIQPSGVTNRYTPMPCLSASLEIET